MGVAERTGRVRRLALVGPAGHGSGRQREIRLVDWRQADGAARTRDLLWRNLAELMIAPASDIDAMALDIHERACRAARFQSRHFSQSAHLPTALAAFDAPVLGVWGRRTRPAWPSAWHRPWAWARPNGPGPWWKGRATGCNTSGPMRSTTCC